MLSEAKHLAEFLEILRFALTIGHIFSFGRARKFASRPPGHRGLGDHVASEGQAAATRIFVLLVLLIGSTRPLVPISDPSLPDFGR